jgi:hypothetical protein
MEYQLKMFPVPPFVLQGPFVSKISLAIRRSSLKNPNKDCCPKKPGIVAWYMRLTPCAYFAPILTRMMPCVPQHADNTLEVQYRAHP